MIKVNDFLYKENGRHIQFFRRRGSKYEFCVLGNEELTEILLANVTTKKVPQKGILDCARTLFALLRDDISVRPLLPYEETKDLYKRFWDSYCKEPTFDIEDLSQDDKLHFKATLTNSDINNRNNHIGESRTIEEAKALALLALLGSSKPERISSYLEKRVICVSLYKPAVSSMKVELELGKEYEVELTNICNGQSIPLVGLHGYFPSYCFFVLEWRDRMECFPDKKPQCIPATGVGYPL